MGTSFRLVVLLVVGAPVAATACSIGETTYETVTLPVRAKNETRTCESPFAKPPLRELESCGDGKGHCFDGARTPLPESKLRACTGSDVCVPDKLLLAGGEKLKACTFLNKKPGACLSLLVKDIELHKNELQRDVCDDDERCAPCVDPTNGEDTHLCDPIGVHERACVGGEGASAETCCHGFGVCMNEDAAPEGSREDLQRETCPSKQVCAPAAMVEGRPVKCDVLGVAGVCLDTCFASMLRPTTVVMRGGCGPTELCLPCAIGKGQGMPGCD
ncbi:MAG: hypothetical protein KF850_11160 [Labilithrix sp.]|nr:hypothetical protein [Labilithrix sp.]